MNINRLDSIIEKVESLRSEVYQLTEQEAEILKDEVLKDEFQNAKQSVSLLKRDLLDIRRFFSKREKAD